MTLKKVYSNIIPFKGYLAMTVWPWVFIRESAKERFTATAERHETTHGLQQVECLWVFFFLLYALEYVIKIPFCGFDTHKAYRSINFEQEAYSHEEELYYNDVRKRFAWVKQIFTVI